MIRFVIEVLSWLMGLLVMAFTTISAVPAIGANSNGEVMTVVITVSGYAKIETPDISFRFDPSDLHSSNWYRWVIHANRGLELSFESTGFNNELDHLVSYVFLIPEASPEDTPKMYVLRPKSKLENAARILSRGDYECYLMISVNGESKTSPLWWNLPPDQQCTDYLTVTVTEQIET